jgi:type II secretory pathway predicted ATPase ExeA
MYRKFYGLNAKPFHITPDLEFLFMSSKHKVALDCMEFGLMNNAGIILITGEIGIGKTTLIQQLLQGIEKDIPPACIHNTNLNPDQFLSLVLQEFGMDADTCHKNRNILLIQESLKSMRSSGQRPLLIVDDAQNLTFEVLEEVRWLSGLQDKKGMLLQIMLVGQPELNAILQHPSMASLSQRIGVSYHLKPLTRGEAEAYILHRLQKVGRLNPLFTTSAIDAIFDITAGIPRTINLLCDNALVYGFADSLQQIDAPIIELVVKEIGTFCGGLGNRLEKRNTACELQGQTGYPSAQKWKNEAEKDESHRILRESMSGILQRLKMLEERTDLLDQTVGIYANELQEILRTQLAEERRRNENLIFECAQLKARLRAEKGTDTEKPEPVTPLALSTPKKVRE